jgi:hypothetical protein
MSQPVMSNLIFGSQENNASQAAGLSARASASASDEKTKSSERARASIE